MTASLMRRVFWELVSALAEASLWIAVALLVWGVIHAVTSGLARAFNPKSTVKKKAHTHSFLRIAGFYFAVLSMTYSTFESSSLLVSLIYIFTTLALFGLLYLVLFRELNGDTKWTRFAQELRRPDLAFYVVIAALQVGAFSTGSALASKLMNAEPRTVLTKTGELQATVIDGSELGFLLMTKGGLILIPLHEVRQIELSEPK